MTLPMLVPVITSTGTPASSSTRNTPMWASPRAAPPERATPTFWARAPPHGSANATSTRANRFTVCPVVGLNGYKLLRFRASRGVREADWNEAREMQQSGEGSPTDRTVGRELGHDPPAELRPTADARPPHRARPPAGAGGAGGRAS